MALSYKARRRWALVILLIGMPAYVITATTIVSELERPAIWLEFLIYLVLGIAWILPFRFVFRGVGQPDPDAPEDDRRS